ncbi:hypothetical protein BKA56DRAFT_485594 [Ilyonectria sp. MPI-CAGE-AT-0026]|nr:hypothetical protein BKA56DRAFT_485594 [Ilyonectria sp. MPI-CAGE-AT-0026]
MAKLLQADAVVIGAGFSGLQAAVDVQKAGLSVYVLEALDRIGGKSYTKKLQSGRGHVELGCTWINGTTQTRMSALVEKYGLETRKQYLDGVELTLDATGQIHSSRHGEPPSVSESKIVQLINSEQRKFDPSSPGQPKQTPAYADTSLDEWLQLLGAQKGRFAYEGIRFVCIGMYGREPEEVGLYPFLELVESCFDWDGICSDDVGGGQHLKIRQGTSSLCSRLAGELRANAVLLSSPVTQVYQNDHHCLVTTQNGYVVDCSKVIITAPATTWDNIAFTPPLPAKKRDIFAASQAGYYTKMVLTYREAWWKELGLLGKFASWNGPLAFSWDISDERYDQYSIACFIVSSRDCAPFRELTRLEREKAVLDNIAEMLAKEYHDLVYNVLEINEQDWYGERWIRGVTYPSMASGKHLSLAPAIKEPFMNLHFGGTETAAVFRGYMEGAVESGERTAAEVIQEMKGPARAKSEVSLARL